MNTTFSFAISCEKGRKGQALQVLGEAHHIVQELEYSLSEFLEHSPVSRLNHARVGEKISLSPDAIYLLERSKEISDQTEGAFDPTAKGYGPTPRIGWDPQTLSAWRCHAGAKLGFGAIGKGYALDRVREWLHREGFFDYFLSGGGSSVILSGFRSCDQPWRWGWSWRRNQKQKFGLSLTHLSGENISLGISGLQERGGHLLNPLSSLPCQGPQSVLVACGSAADSDALSTALFVSGWEEGVKRLEKWRPAMAMIDEEGTPHWNGVFQRIWGRLDE